MASTQIDSRFRIKEEDLCAAAAALINSKNAPSWYTILDKEGVVLAPSNARSFLYVVFGLVNVELRSFNSNGDIDTINIREDRDDIWTAGERLRMLKVIAPYVREGSKIEFINEKGEHWRYYFAEGTMLWQRASTQLDWTLTREINED